MAWNLQAHNSHGTIGSLVMALCLFTVVINTVAVVIKHPLLLISNQKEKNIFLFLSFTFSDEH